VWSILKTDMPESDPVLDTAAAIAAALEALDNAFRPLLKQLSHDLEPAVILSESAVSYE
jgi:hypothetical protein